MQEKEKKPNKKLAPEENNAPLKSLQTTGTPTQKEQQLSHKKGLVSRNSGEAAQSSSEHRVRSFNRQPGRPRVKTHSAREWRLQLCSDHWKRGEGGRGGSGNRSRKNGFLCVLYLRCYYLIFYLFDFFCRHRTVCTTSRGRQKNPTNQPCEGSTKRGGL